MLQFLHEFEIYVGNINLELYCMSGFNCILSKCAESTNLLVDKLYN